MRAAAGQETDLSQRLDELRRGLAEAAPKDYLDEVARAARDDSERLDREAVRVGSVAPDFELQSATGAHVSLATLRRAGPVVLSFFRGAWCPFCNAELEALERALPAIRGLGASLVGISPQVAGVACRSSGGAGEPCPSFDILKDRGNGVARRYGLVYHLNDRLQRYSREFGIDLEEVNGDDTWDLPVPGTFVIDRAGSVRFAFVNEDFTERAEPTEILRVLRSLAQSAA